MKLTTLNKILLIVIAILSPLCVYLAFFHNSGTISTHSYSLLDPTAEIDKEQDKLVRFQPLRQAINAQYENHPDFHVGIYFEYLPTGSNIVTNKDRAMWPASLIKVPVAMAVMKKIEKGEWQLGNELVILDQDKDETFGNLYRQPSGTSVTIEELLKATLIDSDNTAHFVLLRNLSGKELEDVFVHLGLDEVLDKLSTTAGEANEDNRMTAKTYSVFFRSLFYATYLSPQYSQLFLSYLLDSRFEYAALGLPKDTSFAHKTGIREEEGVWADSGIVYLDRRPYVLTVMLESKNKDKIIDESTPQQLFTDISSQIYTYVSTLK